MYLYICVLVAISGFVALSWEVIWQIKSGLALGVSAWGAAITLSVMMGGMSLGSYVMGKMLSKIPPKKIFICYGLLEIIIGVAGLLLHPAFQLLEYFDTAVYKQIPQFASTIYLLGMVLVLAIPSACMGATIPIFGRIARQFHASITGLYGINIFGAACGSLAISLMLIPILGMTKTIMLLSAINIFIGLMIAVIKLQNDQQEEKKYFEKKLPIKNYIIVFVTGFVTFILEIAWFRALQSIFVNTTDIFAMMLACVLIGLYFAARKTSILKQKGKQLGPQLLIAGILVLIFTAFIERLDFLFIYSRMTPAANVQDLNWLLINLNSFHLSWLAIFHYIMQLLLRFLIMFILIVPAISFIGLALPWLLDAQDKPENLGKIYATNTFAAILGSLGAAWLLLPTIGFVKTAWLAALMLMVLGIFITSLRQQLILILVMTLVFIFTVRFETGIGTIRAQGYRASDNRGHFAKLLASYEGPDVTLYAIETAQDVRGLLINSSVAAWDSGLIPIPSIHYLAWMGHLPMLIHPDPKEVLVICFGTGQTANAVRKENPSNLDIVDINKHVFELAHYFKGNENVLADNRVKTIVMDGRAYVRRTSKTYDVITLEPMPPITIGVNALYSKEFYELARDKLSANGIIAQWLPFHIAAPRFNASIAKTFLEVFPNAMLFLDEASQTGILLGSKSSTPITATSWPGFTRTPIARNLSKEQVTQSIVLDTNELNQYASYGETITDDNQLLSYGSALYTTGVVQLNYALLHKINNKIQIKND